VRCKLEVVDLFTAEMDLGIEIISNYPAFQERTAATQNSCYLYAALSSVEGLKPTLAECRELLAGPKVKYVLEQLRVLCDGLAPKLTEYYKQFDDGKGEGGADPLPAGPGGPGNGPQPSQSPGLVPKSSGASRRGK
jgi:hypothetical protein